MDNTDTPLREISKTENLTHADKEFEKTVRPDNFGEFVGQHKVVENLKIFVEAADRKSTRLNSSHIPLSRMPSSA